MDDKLLLGIIVVGTMLLLMIYWIKQDGNMPSFIMGWILLIMAFISFEVKYGFLYVLGFIFLIVMAAVIFYHVKVKPKK